uniref:Tripartite motif-containing protein 46 n=1 Tax=Knipowitschia caucasica TaxID=637954 RepID=A0AAV2K780_KNICA
MKSLEQELHCSVCKDIVKQPVVLPCQHSVCLMCASEVLVASGYPPPDLPPEPNSPASTPNTRSPRGARRPTPKTDQRPIDRLLRSGPHPPSPSLQRSPYGGRRRKDAPPLIMMFPCGACRRDVELGERGLTECLRNLTLERIVERYRHTVSLGSVAVMCQFCKPPHALEASKGCGDCKANFCNECFKLYHPWGTPRAQHEHILPTLNFRPKVLTCTEHDQEKLQFYCRTCQRLLCPLCKLRRVHGGHKILPVAQAYQALKEKITKEMNYILSNQDTVLSQITQLESAITQTEVNSVSAREQLAQSIRDLTAALAERHSSLTQALEGARQRRGEALSGQVSERRSLMEHAGLMAFTQELLKETDQPCFVQAARQTHNRLSKAIENLQHFSLAADPSFRHFQLDVSKELKLLTELNFIQAPQAPVLDTQRSLAYDQLYLCWRLPPESAPAWHYSVEYRRRGVVPGGGARGGHEGGSVCGAVGVAEDGRGHREQRRHRPTGDGQCLRPQGPRLQQGGVLRRLSRESGRPFELVLKGALDQISSHLGAAGGENEDEEEEEEDDDEEDDDDDEEEGVGTGDVQTLNHDPNVPLEPGNLPIGCNIRDLGIR